MTLEYTISKGWDAHTFAGYAKYVTSTPEEAVERQGTFFQPDCDSVVRREVGTEEWSYHPEDQKYDYWQKLEEWKLANKERLIQRELWRPKQSSALPNNRRARTGRPFLREGKESRVWLYTRGELDIERTFGREDGR